MNTIDQLRATLAEHADLEDDGLAQRTASVAGRVRGVRRRRAAAGVGAVAAAVAGIAALTVGLPDADRAAPPAESPDGDYAVDGITYRAHIDDRSGERDLLAADIGAEGQREVTVTVTVTDSLWFSDFCVSSAQRGPGEEPYATLWVDDWFYGGSDCVGGGGEPITGVDRMGSVEVDDRPGLTIKRDGPGSSTPSRSWEPGEEITVTLRISGPYGETWAEPLPEDLRLGLGVYAVR